MNIVNHLFLNESCLIVSTLTKNIKSLGNIYYFDAVLSNSKDEPVEKKKAICMHEEDDGLLWKHVEYRSGHNE